MSKDQDKHNKLFLFFALTIGVFLACRYLGPELYNTYSVQDDFRQSFFWLWQYYDDTLLKNDFFAEMYKSHVTRLPILNLIFLAIANLKIDLVIFSKYFALLIGILSTVAAYLYFHIISKNKIISLFFCAFMSFLFYSTDHISAAQARSFIWLGLFLYMYLKAINKNFFTALLTFLLLFLSPNTFMLCLAMEGFAMLKEVFDNKKINFKSTLFVSTLVNAFSALFLYKIIFKDIQTQGVGTPFSKLEMQNLPEFLPGGRHPIFGSHFFDGTWFRNEHWGFGYGYHPVSKVVFIGLAVSIIYFIVNKFFVSTKVHKICSVIFLISSSLSLYFLSQLTFPLLYLPSRYIAVPTMVVAVVFIFLFFEQLTNLKSKISNQKLKLVMSLVLPFSFCCIFFAEEKKYIHLRYVSMLEATVKVLQQTPINSLIAGFPMLPDLNSASILAKRKIYVDYERSMAYTKESLKEIRKRNLVAIKMTYATTKEEFLALAQQEGITHFLALRDLYNYRNLQNARYINPYNQFLKQTIIQAKGQFFLAQYLDQIKQQYALIDIASLVNSAS